MNTHLNKHVIDNKEKVDDFRCHDKDDEATCGLVKTHTLKLTAKLKCSWKKYKAKQLYFYSAFVARFYNSWVFVQLSHDN